MPAGVDADLYCCDIIHYATANLFGVAPDRAVGHWFEQRCLKTLRTYPATDDQGQDSPTRDRLIKGTARVLLNVGVAGLTHRAVAAQARLTLSTTTYHFNSLQDLALSGYERIRSNLLAGVAAPGIIGSDSAAPLELATEIAHVWTSERALREHLLAGLLDLNLAAARDQALVPVAASVIAAHTKLGAEYLVYDNKLGVRTFFEAHLSYVVSQSMIMLMFARFDDVDARIEACGKAIESLHERLFASG